MAEATLYKLTDAQGQTHGGGTINIQGGEAVKLEGLAWSGAASKAALERMAARRNNSGRNTMAAVTLYKLTDAQGQTHGDGTNHTQWGAGITHEAKGPADGPLCSASWIHAYEHPLVAVLLNPIHANLKNPQLWSCRGEIGKRDGPLKCGCRALTTVEVLPLPEITTEQRVRFAIGCAWPRASVAWKKRATGWLSGKDRTAAAARAAAAAWEAAAAQAAVEAWAEAWVEAFNLFAIAEWAITEQPIEALYPAEVKP
jgi:hypothetical protein